MCPTNRQTRLLEARLQIRLFPMSLLAFLHQLIHLHFNLKPKQGLAPHPVQPIFPMEPLMFFSS
jgi:hypothetical protein